MPAMFNAGLTDPRDTEAEHIIGLDGLIVVTNRANPVSSISLEELALIYSGAMTNWSQMGGPDQPITIYAGADETGTFQTLQSLVLAPYGVQMTPNAQRFTSNVAISDAVAGNQWGIGVTAAAYERAAKALPIRQECGILSFPTTFAMKTGEYPLSRRLYLYTPRGDMTAHARNLVEFAQSSEAQALIVDAGFVSLEVETALINNQGARIVHAMTGEEEVSLQGLRDFVLDVKDAVRLSTTFRFTPGESRLDPVSQAAAEQFARDISNGVYEGKEVMLIGFTDSVGQFDLNRGPVGAARPGRRRCAGGIRSGRRVGTLDDYREGLWRTGAGRLQHVAGRTFGQPSGRGLGPRPGVTWLPVPIEDRRRRRITSPGR